MRSRRLVLPIVALALLWPSAPALADGPVGGIIECDCGPADPPPGPFPEPAPGFDNSLNYVFNAPDIAAAVQNVADAIGAWLMQRPEVGGGGASAGEVASPTVDCCFGGGGWGERDW